MRNKTILPAMLLLIFGAFSLANARVITVVNKLKFNSIVIETYGQPINATSNLTSPIKVWPGSSRDIELEHADSSWHYQVKVSVTKWFSFKLTPICLWTHTPHGYENWQVDHISYINNITKGKGPKYKCGGLFLPQILYFEEWPNGFWDGLE